MSEDIVYHWPGTGPLSGDYKGMDAVLEFFGRVGELSQGTLTQEIHAIIADDEHAVALVTASAQRDGKTLHEKSVDVFHIRDGKVTEAWGFLEDTAVDAAFWS
jgi:ketosteroid isomerase-like protein